MKRGPLQAPVREEEDDSTWLTISTLFLGRNRRYEPENPGQDFAHIAGAKIRNGSAAPKPSPWKSGVIAAYQQEVGGEEIEKGTFRQGPLLSLECHPHSCTVVYGIGRKTFPCWSGIFWRNTAGKTTRKLKSISERALEMLMCLEWPGNVRELKNLVERYGHYDPGAGH